MDSERKMNAEDPLGEAKPEGQNPSSPTGPTNPLSLCDHDNEVVVGRPEGPGAPTQTEQHTPGEVTQKTRGKQYDDSAPKPEAFQKRNNATSRMNIDDSA